MLGVSLLGQHSRVNKWLDIHVHVADLPLAPTLSCHLHVLIILASIRHESERIGWRFSLKLRLLCVKGRLRDAPLLKIKIIIV